ncbi:MAG: ferritin family protein, partial [Pseudomonadota bacterium]
ARLAVFGDLHADEVAEHAENLTLPKLAPWEYRWPDPEGPETQPYEHGHYQLTVPEALAYAHQNESRGKAFYELVAQETQSAVVKELAEEFVEEEAEHVRLLEEWIARTPAESVGEDPDPPNVVA